MDAQAESWQCGSARAEALIIGNRIGGYRWVIVGGCGYHNRPDAEKCWHCGREKR